MKALLPAAALLLAASLAAGPLWAVEPDEMLANPALEARARDLSRQLRCVVCLNQDIDSSNAEVARTMRILLRERLVAGASDQEVRAFFVKRYGDFVLFRPPLKASTYVLWVAPFLLLGGGTAIAIMALRARRDDPPPEPLADDEARRLKTLLRDTRRIEE